MKALILIFCLLFSQTIFALKIVYDSDFTDAQKKVGRKMLEDTLRLMKEYPTPSSVLKHYKRILTPTDYSNFETLYLRTYTQPSKPFDSCHLDKLTLQCGEATLELISPSILVINNKFFYDFSDAGTFYNRVYDLYGENKPSTGRLRSLLFNEAFAGSGELVTGGVIGGATVGTGIWAYRKAPEGSRLYRAVHGPLNWLTGKKAATDAAAVAAQDAAGKAAGGAAEKTVVGAAEKTVEGAAKGRWYTRLANSRLLRWSLGTTALLLAGQDVYYAYAKPFKITCTPLNSRSVPKVCIDSNGLYSYLPFVGESCFTFQEGKSSKFDQFLKSFKPDGTPRSGVTANAPSLLTEFKKECVSGEILTDRLTSAHSNTSFGETRAAIAHARDNDSRVVSTPAARTGQRGSEESDEVDRGQ